MKYLKKFENHTAYAAAESGLILPNVSLCVQENEVHYNPLVPPSRVITAVFNIPTTANPISLTYENGWVDVESVLVTSPNGSTFELSYSDLVEYDSMEGIDPFMGYQFDATGNYTFEYTLKPNVDTINGDLFTNIPYITSITIPNIVTNIGNYAFGGCSNLTSITIPSSVISIGMEAFYKCSGLTSVTIGNGVTSIGNGAFSYCSSLTSINTPNGVTSIGGSAFQYCSGLTSITIPSSVTSIGNGVFSYCSSLTSIVVDSGNSVYDSRNNCNAIIETSTNTLIQGCQNTILPNSVTSIGIQAFRGCSSLTSVTIPSSVTSIGESAFQGCGGLTSVTIPNIVTSIGNWAFQGCGGLTSVTIPNSVTSIGDGAFGTCSGLTSVTIGNSVTSIGYWAFGSCSGLTSVTIQATTPPTLGSTPFDNTNNCPIYVPSSSVETYKAASGWSSYASRIQAIPTP